jgi:threonine aldolase
MIDLRSDTLTRPTEGMRAAMATASVGDDVYGEDPTINELERRTADLLGHEAGLFCASGSLANLLGVRLLVEPGQEVLCDEQAHIVRAEMGAHAAVNGVTTRTFPSKRGLIEAEKVAMMMAPQAGPYLVSTAAVAVENTHNFGGGTVQPFDQLAAVGRLCRDHGVGYHLDGARLWNAHVATGIGLSTYGNLFDTVTVSFSKGLGAPVGSALVSSAANVTRARVWRKRLGGGMRQAGILAAGALYALDHQLERLSDDHAAARAFAAALAERVPDAVASAAVETNIVVVDTGRQAAQTVVGAAAEQGVRLAALGPSTIRAVTHLDVTTADCARAGAVVGDLLRG